MRLDGFRILSFSDYSQNLALARGRIKHQRAVTVSGFP
jgi:hypothetical protein